MKSIILIISIVSFLGACSTLKIDNANNCPKGADVERCKVLGQSVKKTAEDVPEWMLILPEDDKAFYSAGTAVSRDMQLAIDKANLAAKRNLADRIGGELSSQIKEFVIEGGDMYTSDLITVDVERVTKNIMARINVAGYVPSKMEVYPLGTMYRVYALIEYPIGAHNDILIEQIRRNRALYAHVRSSVAFKELEVETNEKRQRDLEDTAAVIEAAGGSDVE
tara:strand:- start:326 stop:991 length:666 start_codon:yes stop_codon:yes gene_type:complete